MSGDTSVIVQPCDVTIELHTLADHDKLHAIQYEMFDDRCLWYGDDGNPLLEHIFSKPVGDRFPWRSSVVHKQPYPVAFTSYQARDSRVRCLKHAHEHLDLSPRYFFTNWDEYKAFQGALCHAIFETEFEMVSITWRESKDWKVTPQESKKMFIKVWRPWGPDNTRRITIPLKYRADSHDHLKHWEIQLNMFDYKLLDPSKVKLDLIADLKRPSTSEGLSVSSSIAQSPPSPHKSRRLSSLFKKHSMTKAFPTPPTTPLRRERQVASPQLLKRFHDFTLQFALSDDQDRFLAMFDQTSTPHPGSPRSLNLGEPLWRDTFHTPPRPSLPHRRTPSPHPGPLQLPGSILPEPLQLSDYLLRGGPKIPSRQPLENRSLDTLMNFHYTPLADSEIRIIEIKRGEYTTEDDLCCDLKPYSLEKLPRYEALSYCWGSGASTRSIPAGHLQGFPISIHLWQALKRLRLPDRSRLVWTDKICIQQSDVEEKNQQIALMPTIYARAVRTIIWIGETDPKQGLCKRRWANEGESEPTLCAPIADDASAPVSEHLSAENLQGAIEQLQSSDKGKSGEVWWKRLWCVQEFYYTQNPPTVLFGPHALQWEHFSQAFDQTAEQSLTLFNQLWTEKRRSSSNPHSLFRLLSLTGGFECSDRRDRVFALLGMSQSMLRQSSSTTTGQNGSLGLHVDYGKSVVRILEDATRLLITLEQTLDVLLDERERRVVTGLPDGKDLPSWLPDFRSLQERRIVRGEDKYKSGGSRPPEVRLFQPPPPPPSSSSFNHGHSDQDEPRWLVVKALKFDRIQKRVRVDLFDEAVSEEQNMQPGREPYEHSPEGFLVYNSLMTRGSIVDRILNALDYDVDTHKSNTKSKNIDWSPAIGRLMLDYLFEGKHKIQDEYDRRKPPQRTNVQQEMKRQEIQDLRYINDDTNSTADENYVKQRWQHKENRYTQNQKLQVKRLATALHDEEPDSAPKTVTVDLDVARSVENLFLFARLTKRRYYLTLKDENRPNGLVNFEAPMRKDTLDAPSFSDVVAHSSHSEIQVKRIEFHEYKAKYRERDFFKTEEGFLGLGPSALEEGDRIIVPQGSSRPWIVRKVRGHYIFIGDAVIPNIMSEAWFVGEEGQPKEYCIR